MFANWYAELNFFCFATVLPVSAVITAPSSVCDHAVLGALAAWIQNPRKKEKKDPIV